MVHINSDDAERRAIRHARFEIVLSLVVESLHRAAQFQRVGGHITRQSGVVHLSGRHEKILLLIASANRDESRWERPDQLDITRRGAGHIAFGTGIHGCVGHMVARLEGEAALGALAALAASIEIVGDAVHRDSTGLRALSSLPVRVVGK